MPCGERRACGRATSAQGECGLLRHRFLSLLAEPGGLHVRVPPHGRDGRVRQGRVARPADVRDLRVVRAHAPRAPGLPHQTRRADRLRPVRPAARDVRGCGRRPCVRSGGSVSGAASEDLADPALPVRLRAVLHPGPHRGRVHLARPLPRRDPAGSVRGHSVGLRDWDVGGALGCRDVRDPVHRGVCSAHRAKGIGARRPAADNARVGRRGGVSGARHGHQGATTLRRSGGDAAGRSS